MEIVEIGRLFFKIVETGDCFTYDGQLYMKIQPVMLHDEEMNAVSLSTGTVVQFFDDTEVVYKNARIVYGGAHL